jgi:hypothetical protein
MLETRRMSGLDYDSAPFNRADLSGPADTGHRLDRATYGFCLAIIAPRGLKSSALTPTGHPTHRFGRK